MEEKIIAKGHLAKSGSVSNAEAAVIIKSLKLYHGTDTKFEIPDMNHGGTRLDSGRGVYFTNDPERAKKRALCKNENNGTTEAWLLEFEWIDDLSDLTVKYFEDFTTEWAKLVILCRYQPNGKNFQHGYDIVAGPVADGKRTNEIVSRHVEKWGEKYLDEVALLDFISRVNGYGLRYKQIALCSKKALAKIKRVNASYLTKEVPLAGKKGNSQL